MLASVVKTGSSVEVKDIPTFDNYKHTRFDSHNPVEIRGSISSKDFIELVLSWGSPECKHIHNSAVLANIRYAVTSKLCKAPPAPDTITFGGDTLLSREVYHSAGAAIPMLAAMGANWFTQDEIPTPGRLGDDCVMPMHKLVWAANHSWEKAFWLAFYGFTVHKEQFMTATSKLGVTPAALLTHRENAEACRRLSKLMSLKVREKSFLKKYHRHLQLGANISNPLKSRVLAYMCAAHWIHSLVIKGEMVPQERARIEALKKEQGSNIMRFFSPLDLEIELEMSNMTLEYAIKRLIWPLFYEALKLLSNNSELQKEVWSDAKRSSLVKWFTSYFEDYFKDCTFKRCYFTPDPDVDIQETIRNARDQYLIEPAEYSTIARKETAVSVIENLKEGLRIRSEALATIGDSAAPAAASSSTAAEIADSGAWAAASSASTAATAAACTIEYPAAQESADSSIRPRRHAAVVLAESDEEEAPDVLSCMTP